MLNTEEIWNHWKNIKHELKLVGSRIWWMHIKNWGSYLLKLNQVHILSTQLHQLSCGSAMLLKQESCCVILTLSHQVAMLVRALVCFGSSPSIGNLTSLDQSVPESNVWPIKSTWAEFNKWKSRLEVGEECWEGKRVILVLGLKAFYHQMNHNTLNEPFWSLETVNKTLCGIQSKTDKLAKYERLNPFSVSVTEKCFYIFSEFSHQT